MGIIESFAGFFSKGSGSESGYGNSEYSNEVSLGTDSYLTYDECKDLYLHWALGKRVVGSITNFAMSVPREITFEDLPQDVVGEYEKFLQSFKINTLVRQAANYARIYGLSAIFVSHRVRKPNEALSYEDLNPNDIQFNILDPLNLAGLQISQDPLSINYQRVTSIHVGGQSVHPTRICVLFNDIPLYLRWIPSTYSWGSPSVFENMRGLIKSWNRCVISLERIATKAGSLVVKHRDGAVINSIAVRAARETLEQIRNMQNDGIASLEKDSDVEFFNLTGSDAVNAIIEQMNKLIMLALADTPSSILLDKNLAEGFSDGAEDMKAVLMATDSFREKMLQPIYTFLDFYMLRMCFRESALAELKTRYASDFEGLDVPSLKEKILQGYRVEWGNLYPQKETEKIQNVSSQIDTISKLKELGANISDLEQIVNNVINPFDTEITFHEIADDEFGSDSHDSHESDYDSDLHSVSESSEHEDSHVKTSSDSAPQVPTETQEVGTEGEASDATAEKPKKARKTKLKAKEESSGESNE